MAASATTGLEESYRVFMSTCVWSSDLNSEAPKGRFLLLHLRQQRGLYYVFMFLTWT